MIDESGFAEPVVVEGGEGDSADPKAAFERSPLKVLASLAERPLEQAVKAIDYIKSSRDRERRYLKACSPQALSLIAQNGPEYATSVQAVSN
jgi:capsule polysaccharide export protein KpsE/RkpR